MDTVKQFHALKSEEKPVFLMHLVAQVSLAIETFHDGSSGLSDPSAVRRLNYYISHTVRHALCCHLGRDLDESPGYGCFDEYHKTEPPPVNKLLVKAWKAAYQVLRPTGKAAPRRKS